MSDRRVLIVDDHAEIREVLREMLSISDVEVHEAGNGPEGLALAREHLPGVVLLDLSMPGMNGMEVLAQLKADPNTAGARVIVLTGHTDLECQEAVEAGADECFQKPFQAIELLELIDRLLPSA